MAEHTKDCFPLEAGKTGLTAGEISADSDQGKAASMETKHKAPRVFTSEEPARSDREVAAPPDDIEEFSKEIQESVFALLSESKPRESNLPIGKVNLLLIVECEPEEHLWEWDETTAVEACAFCGIVKI